MADGGVAVAGATTSNPARPTVTIIKKRYSACCRFSGFSIELMVSPRWSDMYLGLNNCPRTVVCPVKPVMQIYEHGIFHSQSSFVLFSYNSERSMCTEPFEQKNVCLDQILAERRSCRMFKPDMPAKDDIERIIHAGLLAPYAAAAVGGSKDYFRRFFVLKKGSVAMTEVIPLVFHEVERMSAELEQGMRNDPLLKTKAISFVERLSTIRKMGRVPGIGTAPYYIVVAERRGFPPVELQSLAHCLENMWLKATALCLGFQIVSITSRMSTNPEFCRVLGLPVGEWEFMGCAIGYPQEELPPR